MIPYITKMFYLTPKRVLLLLQAKDPKSGTVKNLFFLRVQTWSVCFTQLIS